MDEVEVRKALDELIRSRGETYASVSKLLGRNPTYIQQFIRRGVPRSLEEHDRRQLARHFAVAEQRLGGPEPEELLIAADNAGAAPGALVQLPFLDAAEGGPTPFAFQAEWLRGLADGPLAALALVRVEGEAMLPTLGPGDIMIVDTADSSERVRDGLYLLRVEGGATAVKRLAFNPADRTVTILSDNRVYPSWDGCNAAHLAVVGRVIWAARTWPG